MNPYEPLEEEKDYSKPINSLKDKLMAMKKDLSTVTKAHAKMAKEEEKEKDKMNQAPTPEDHQAALSHFKNQYMNAKRNKDDAAATDAARGYHDYSNKLADIYQRKLKEDMNNPYSNQYSLDEAVTVDKKKYSWGKMVTVHHGSDTSFPLHPEHQAAIKKLRPGMKTTFKDETGRQIHAHREGDDVHLVHHNTGSSTAKKTTVGYHHFDEGYSEDDIARGGTVIYRHGGKHYMSKVSHMTGGGAGTKIHTTSKLGHEVKLNHVVSTDASDWKRFKDKTVNEAKDPGEYDQEGDMAMTQLRSIAYHAKQLHDQLKPNDNLPEWVQSKITLAQDYMQTAHDYMVSQMNEEVEDNYTGSRAKKLVKHSQELFNKSKTETDPEKKANLQKMSSKAHKIYGKALAQHHKRNPEEYKKYVARLMSGAAADYNKPARMGGNWTGD